MRGFRTKRVRNAQRSICTNGEWNKKRWRELVTTMKTTQVRIVSLALVLFAFVIGLPETGQAQTYYIQSQTSVPFPYDPYGGAEPIVTLDANRQIYQVQDNTNDWDMLMTARELDARSTFTSMEMDLPPDPTTDTNAPSGSGTNSYTLGTVSYSTNDLWLQIVSVTNSTANLVIHPPWNVTNGVYDLYYCTNLISPITWQWLLRTPPGQTNLDVANAADAQGFYRLGFPNDLTATDSVGTNFWGAFFYMLNSSPSLSLYISGPVGATGTVNFPGFTYNGPVMIVTNCGDAGLNGTYVLTNLTAQEQVDWQNNGLDATDVGYVNGTNWVDFFTNNGKIAVIFGYDTNAGICTIYYYKNGGNLNGSQADWMQFEDTNSPSPTTVCAQIPASQPFTVVTGAVTRVPIDSAMMTAAANTVEINGIHVTSSQPVSVYGVDFSTYVSSAFTFYPTPLLGTNYCLMSRASFISGFPSEVDRSTFGIVAVEDNTTVTVTPSETAQLADMVIELQQGQTYQLNSDDYSGDVTGTWVTSDKPICVFAGDTEAYVPNGNVQSGNPLMQEQLPVDSWGTQALSLSFAGRSNGDVYRVLAAYSNTTVTISTTNGVLLSTNLEAGTYCETNLDGPVEFESSKPVQVAKFANGWFFDNLTGDPCEILLPPTGFYLLTNTVVTLPNDDVTGDFGENHLNIIVPQAAITNTFVDGATLPLTNFVAFGTSGYYGAQITVTNSGPHTVISSQPVGVEVYGFGDYDAYGYFGGVVK
jgi:IgGFc binding protein